MANIENVNGSAAGRIQQSARSNGGPAAERHGPETEESTPMLKKGDSISISAEARNAAAAAPVRTELVERVRGEIEAERYVSEDKLDAILDRLARDVFAL